MTSVIFNPDGSVNPGSVNKTLFLKATLTHTLQKTVDLKIGDQTVSVQNECLRDALGIELDPAFLAELGYVPAPPRADNPAVTYGETTESREYTVYVVEAIWPDSSRPAERERWGRYKPGAWNDRNLPNQRRNSFGHVDGNFEAKHPDLYHISRITNRMGYGDGFGGDFASIPAFTKPGPALAYAERLNKVGQSAAVYSDGGSDAERQKYAGEVRTRVVEERMARITRVVEGVR